METMTGKTTAKIPTAADQQITGGPLLARTRIGTACAVVAAGSGTTDALTGVANAWYEESAMDAAKAGVES